MGSITQIRTLGRVPLIDVGTIELIRNGTLPVFPGIERFYERGYPKLLADEADHPGPYFIGFGNPPTGLLREINHQAKAVAAKIAAANQQ